MSVRVSRLSNGLTVASDAMPGVTSASVGVYIGAGARHEGAERNGVAHFLEHMVFKGTRRRSAKAIAEEIEAVGGALNAWTGREQTAFHARVLAEDLPLAVDMIADMLQNSLFDEAELGRERDVILQEIGQAQDTPDDIVFDHFQQAAFPDQALGRPVLGAPETVRAIGRADMLAYRDQRYAASEVTLAAAGAVDHDALVALGEAALGGLPAQRDAGVEPARYSGGEIRDDRDLEQTHIVVGWPGPALDDPRRHAYAVMGAVLGGGMSSRLFYEIREKRGLVYGVHAFMNAFRETGLMGVYAGTGEDQTAEVLDVIGDEIARACEDIDDAEVARAKAQIRASLLMGRESVEGRCDQIAHDLAVFGRTIPTQERLDALAAVDAPATRAALKEMRKGPLTLALVGPTAGAADYAALTRQLTTGTA